MKGRIKKIINSGTIVTLWIKQGRHHYHPVHMDHRMYAHLRESEETIKGCKIWYYAGVIEFLD